jgi:hypothetical protein
MGALTRAGVQLSQYRESHHSIARLVAIGATEDHIRRQTGVTFRRIALLQADPSFKELVEHYRKRVDETWNRNVDQFLDLGMGNMIRSEAMISDKLDEADEKGESIPLLTLNRISQDRADRFGYPKTSQVEHKHDFAALLDRAIERSGKAREVKVIESTAVEVSEGSQSSQTKPPLLPSGPEVSNAPQSSLPPARPSFAAILTTKRRRVA